MIPASPRFSRLLRRHRRAPSIGLALVAALAVSGCVAPQHGGQVDSFRHAVRTAADGDRTKAARAAAGLGAASAGVGLACTMMNDAAPLRVLAPLRAFCAARRTLR